MATRRSARTAARRARSTLVAALVIGGAALAGALVSEAPAPSTASTPTASTSTAEPAAPETVPAAPGRPRLPGTRNLDGDLRDALRDAAADAADDGVQLTITSGWRSREHQQELLDEAVATYGSMEEAARWVATPDTSAHVSGDAVDIGPTGAAGWLARHGAAYGLCRIYDNEPWHFELRPEAQSGGCPPTYPDPTHDPRLHP